VRRKEEWWKGIRARDGQTGWFPATRVVPATPKECADIATALSTLQRAPETMKRKERRAAASRGQGEAQLEANFGAEPKAVESDPEAQREVAELERLAAAHESDARRIVELMRAAAQGRCGEQDEFEHVPLSPGCHAINVGGRPIALLLGDEIELCIDDHALKIEVLLNTVLQSFAFPFVTEFDGDLACLVLVANNSRTPLLRPCTAMRSGLVRLGAPRIAQLAAQSDDAAAAAPPVPAAPGQGKFASLASASVPDELLVRHVAWERSGKPRNVATEPYFDAESAEYRSYLLFWLQDRVVQLLCDDAKEHGNENLVFRSDSTTQCVAKIRRRLLRLLESAAERSAEDRGTKLELVRSDALGACVSALFPVRPSLLALQHPSRSDMAAVVRQLGERYMLIEGRMSAEAVLALSDVVRRPPRRADGVGQHSDTESEPALHAASEFPCTCVAKYSFLAKHESDLSFNTGDRIRVSHRINDDWLYGDMGARGGRFPASFVEFTRDAPKIQAPVEHVSIAGTIRNEEEMIIEADSSSSSDGGDGGDSGHNDDAAKGINEATARDAAAAEAAIEAERERQEAERRREEEEERRREEEEERASLAAAAADLKAQQERKAAEEAAAAATAAAAAAAAAAKRAAEEAAVHAQRIAELERLAAAAAAAEAAKTPTPAPAAGGAGSSSALDVAQIRSWRDVLELAKLKPAEIDGYVAAFDDNAVELDQIYDLDVEVAKLIGIKAGHYLRIQKAVAALKEAGFSP
jgi:hypothetical protein